MSATWGIQLTTLAPNHLPCVASNRQLSTSSQVGLHPEATDYLAYLTANLTSDQHRYQFIVQQCHPILYVI